MTTVLQQHNHVLKQHVQKNVIPAIIIKQRVVILVMHGLPQQPKPRFVIAPVLQIQQRVVIWILQPLRVVVIPPMDVQPLLIILILVIVKMFVQIKFVQMSVREDK